MPHPSPAVRFSLPPTATLSTGVASWSGAIGALPTAPRLKLLHLVRHAQGWHNVDPEGVSRVPSGLDARLTPEGELQCAGDCVWEGDVRVQAASTDENDENYGSYFLYG